MKSSSNQTALIIGVSEVESLVGKFRARHDPACAEGVPAHVTVLYPFLPSSKISSRTLQSLRDIFAECSPFGVTFAELRRFPGALYLSPRPDAEFQHLTENVVSRFPEAPPYGGQFPDIVPHLTVAHAPDQRRLDEIETEFLAAATGKLPIYARLREVTLIQKSDGHWRTWMAFPLGVIHSETSRSAQSL
jgi:2'-5' RNA ligase